MSLADNNATNEEQTFSFHDSAVSHTKYVVSLGGALYFAGKHNENRNELAAVRWQDAQIFEGVIGRKKADRLAIELKQKGWSAAKVIRLI